MALPEDEEKGFGWSVRKELCVKIIRAQKPDIICLQEVLKIQVEDMRRFFPEFISFGFEGPEYAGKTQGNQENNRIDFILMRGKTNASGAQIIRDDEKGHFPSDHYFVSAEIGLG